MATVPFMHIHTFVYGIIYLSYQDAEGDLLGYLGLSVDLSVIPYESE